MRSPRTYEELAKSMGGSCSREEALERAKAAMQMAYSQLVGEVHDTAASIFDAGKRAGREEAQEKSQEFPSARAVYLLEGCLELAQEMGADDMERTLRDFLKEVRHEAE